MSVSTNHALLTKSRKSVKRIPDNLSRPRVPTLILDLNTFQQHSSNTSPLTSRIFLLERAPTAEQLNQGEWGDGNPPSPLLRSWVKSPHQSPLQARSRTPPFHRCQKVGSGPSPPSPPSLSDLLIWNFFEGTKRFPTIPVHFLPIQAG